MAGIGFELKKLYKQGGGMTRNLGAMCYSAMTAIGPALLVVGALISTNLLMDLWGMGEEEKNIFAGSVLYCFVFPLIVSSIFDTILSRYVSDCLYSEETDRLLPAVQGSTVLFAVLFAVAGGGLAAGLYWIGGLDLYYVILVYLLMMGVGLTFGLSVFVSAIKAYRRVTYGYLFGCLLILGVSAVCRLLLGMPMGHSMITGFAVGFLAIAVQLFLFLHMAFPKGAGGYFQFFTGIKGNQMLLLSGFFYSLGLYVHNFVYWSGSDLQLVVRRMLFSAPSYDMATFVAMLTSITSVVLFVVRVETSFYQEYKGYCEAVIGNNLKSIETAREKMARTLVSEVYFIGEIQLIITIILMCVGLTFLPTIGISGVSLDLYPIVALGYYAIFLMHVMMIFLYYFDDQRGAAGVGALFFGLTLCAALLCRRLGLSWYGLPVVVGGVGSWAAAFLRLRWVLRRVDYIMFCDNIKGE